MRFVLNFVALLMHEIFHIQMKTCLLLTWHNLCDNLCYRRGTRFYTVIVFVNDVVRNSSYEKSKTQNKQ